MTIGWIVFLHCPANKQTNYYNADENVTSLAKEDHGAAGILCCSHYETTRALFSRSRVDINFFFQQESNRSDRVGRLRSG